MEMLLDLLKTLAVIRFYGSVEIKMEAGKVVLIKKTETMKPTE